MLACYGTETLGSHPAIGKEESEFRMVLHYNMRTILQNGNEFPEKVITSHFFQSDIWADIYVVFIGPSHFLSAIPIKPTVFKNSAFNNTVAVSHNIAVKLRKVTHPLKLECSMVLYIEDLFI